MKTVMNNPHAAELMSHIDQSTVRSGVIGLEYAGLPLAVELARGRHPRRLDEDDRRGVA
jgi:hypothetical protein